MVLSRERQKGPRDTIEAFQCTLCSQAFTVTERDLAFYEKISPIFNGTKALVPPPTLCPDCRNQRRMSYRNDRTFYLRNCDAMGERFLSIYAPESPYTVYKPSAWYSDNWDPMSFGREIDWNRPFFKQFSELNRAVPTLGIDTINCENSDYCNYCGDDKNCYMDIAGEGNEDSYYNLFIKYSKNCADSTFVYRSTLCYEAINCYDSYNVSHSQYLENCSDCAYCFDLKGCTNCIGCINLRNKQYHISNEPYSKEEYAKRVSALNLCTQSGHQTLLAQSREFMLKSGIYRDMYLLNCENSNGNDLKNSKNTLAAFNAVNCEDCSFLYDVLDAKDCYDLNYSLYKPEASYELCSTLQLSYSAFNMASHYSSGIFYCNQVNHSKDIFGCIGLKHKEYCIFNKQYTKAEYEELVPRLIEYMSSTGEWGQFFPVEKSPFAYNETVAQEYFPLTKEEVQSREWAWSDYAPPPPVAEKLIKAEQLPNSIDDTPDDILNWAIECEITRKPFKLTKQELALYRQLRLPIPRRHSEQRHRDRSALRNPRRLWPRECAKCNKEIETSYSPDRLEIICCENCYLAAMH